MVTFFPGYFVMGLMFLVWRLGYHVVSEKKYFGNSLTSALNHDFVNLRAYVEQIILSNPRKMKMVVGLVAVYVIAEMLPLQEKSMYILEDVVSAIIYFLMVIVFAPPENPAEKGFPVEIFGFLYSIAMMYCSAGDFVLDFFFEDNSFHQDVWIYGYSVVLISYLICMATVSRFMERDLSRIEVIFVGMIMMTILEFITYYGIGFFGGIKFFDLNTFDNSVLDGISRVVNQGVYISSQSEILERGTAEVLGYIILNGTDVLTVTAVLGYVLQKFMGVESKS